MTAGRREDVIWHKVDIAEIDSYFSNQNHKIDDEEVKHDSECEVEDSEEIKVAPIQPNIVPGASLGNCSGNTRKSTAQPSKDLQFDRFDTLIV